MIIEYLSDAVGLLISGGLDSCILLGHLLKRGELVQPFYIRSGLLWEAEELAAIRRFSASLASPGLQELVVLELPLTDVYGDHWSVSGEQIPDQSTPDEAVYLPGRNPLLLIKPALWCQMHGIARLALGVLASNPFPDATEKFFDSYQTALSLATGNPLVIERPLAHLHKPEVMRLGLDYRLELTFSCLSPIKGRHCGLCNKCAERRVAFQSVGVEDPTPYQF